MTLLGWLGRKTSTQTNKLLTIPVFFVCFFCFCFFFLRGGGGKGFYDPFQNISLISSRSFIKGGRKPENPGKNHLTTPKQNLPILNFEQVPFTIIWFVWKTARWVASSVDPGQTPRSVASDMDLHSLLSLRIRMGNMVILERRGDNERIILIDCIRTSTYAWLVCGNFVFSVSLRYIISLSTRPASILYKSTAGRYRPVSYPDGPITARCRFIKNACWAPAF